MLLVIIIGLLELILVNTINLIGLIITIIVFYDVIKKPFIMRLYKQDFHKRGMAL